MVMPVYLYELYICVGFANALCFEHVYTCGAYLF